MKKTIPLYWQNNNEKRLIGYAEVDDETFQMTGIIAAPDIQERLKTGNFIASLGDMMPPGHKLASDAKLTVHGE